MVWALVAALCVIVGLCMHLLAVRGGLQERVHDAQGLIADLYGAERTPEDIRRIESRLRWYCAKWGMVLTADRNIVEGESK